MTILVFSGNIDFSYFDESYQIFRHLIHYLMDNLRGPSYWSKYLGI